MPPPPFFRTQLLLVATTLGLMTLFEAMKELVAPGLSKWQSHAFTIAFAVFVAVTVSHLANRVHRVLHQERAAAIADRDRLTAAIEQSADGVVITDIDGRIEYANDAACRLTGHRPEELLGQTPRLFKSDAHDAAFYRELWDTVLGGRVWHGDITNRRRDGTLYVDRTTIAPVWSWVGKLTHFIAIKEDVTERRKVEAALERMQYSIDHASDGVCWVEADGRFIYANDADCRLLGYTREELLRLTVSDVAPDLPPDAWPAHWQEVKDLGQMVLQTRIRRKDGAEFVAEVSIKFVVFHGVEYHCTFVREVTERVRAQLRLIQSEERYRCLFENNLAGVYRSHVDGRILECNDAFARMFGYSSREEVLTIPATALFPNAAARLDYLARLQRAGRLHHEWMGRRQDGSAAWFLENVSWVGDGILEGTLMDTTQRRSLEEQLRQAQKMEAIGRLAGGVAHDFNNILGVIIGYSEVLLKGTKPGDRQADRLAQILKAAHRAACLTRQLLAFSRKQVLEPRVLDLNELVQDTERMLARLIGENVDIELVLDPELGQVRVDAGQIGQVLLNLAVNARDAMPRGGRLTIETRNLDGQAGRPRHDGQERYVMVAVSDTGCGMSREVQKHIFEPFFTTKEVGRGTGLGLATVYGVVEQSGGSIAVHSEEGQGARFEICLPRCDEVVSPPWRAAPCPTGHGTILLVEDEAALLEITREVLQAQGYEVLTASSGAEGMARSAEHDGPIDLLLTDVVMPGMTGPELASLLRALRPRLRVLPMSGYTHDAIQPWGVLDGGTAPLAKPFESRELLDRVHQALTES